MNISESNSSSLDMQLQSLEQLYTMYNTAHVQRLLRRDPGLIVLLLDAYPSITTQFPDAQVFLHATSDPELSQQEITAFISTCLPPQEAVERLKAVYESGWGLVFHTTRGRIAIGLECI